MRIGAIKIKRLTLKKNNLHHGDCLEKLKELRPNSIDSLVTDPPAGISFMGKDWDDDKGGRDEWIKWMTSVMSECLRVLKPGAHGLVWALPRTSHWTATALEDAGFEVRDVVTHLFGTGFPKSLDISKAIDKAAGAEREVIAECGSDGVKRKPRAMAPGHAERVAIQTITAPATEAAKQWAGWGTALKPASEHWILVRKPCSEKTVAANVLKHGTGGINIDASRIEGAVPTTVSGGKNMSGGGYGARTSDEKRHVVCPGNPGGRFPANLILDEEAAKALDEQSGRLTSGSRSSGVRKGMGFHGAEGDGGPAIAGNGGGASRFFYVAKASKSDKGADNTHPTVKSTALMTYLIKLVTPRGGVILDPFMGSGSTGVAAKLGCFDFVGIEREKAYFNIARTRVGAK